MSKLFYREKSVTGIDIGQTAIKVMGLDTGRDEVMCFGSIDIDAAEMSNALKSGSTEYLGGMLADLLGKKLTGTLSSRKVIVSIPAAYTYTRTLTLPLKAERALQSAVELEAEQYIPVPVSGLNIDYEIIARTDKDLTVLVCAAPRQMINIITGALDGIGLETVAIEPSLMSVGRLLKMTERANLPTIILDIGAVTTDIAAIENGKIRVTGSAPVGGNTFTLAISRALDMSVEQAHQLKVLYGFSFGTKQKALTKALSPDLDIIVREVRKLIRYYNDRLGGPKIEQLLIVGGGANVPGIGDVFTDALTLAARVANPWQKINYSRLSPPARQVKPRYITVAGAASVSPEELWK